MSEIEQNTENKLRKSLSLDPDIIVQGEKLARLEKRSLSNTVEVLIQREHERVFGKNDEAEAKQEVTA